MSNARNLANLLGTGTQITTADIADAAFQANKNLIINGAMQVAQRGTSFTSIAHNGYSLDRYIMQLNGLDGNVDVEQSTTTPEGFASSMKVSVDASNTTLDAGDYLAVQTRLEGQDLQRLKKGTSNAESITFSFWVRSSVASTYTINSADTLEYKTITFAGDTTGTFDNDNALSLQVIFWIDAGTTFTSGTLDTSWATQTNANRVYDTTGWLISSTPTFYITGVQLEVGEQATPFEHRSYGDELARCERYYQIASPLAGNANGTNAKTSVSFKTAMRAQPTLSFASNSFDFTDGYLSNYASTNANPSWTFYVDSGGGVFSTANHASVSGDTRQNTMLMNGSAQKLFMDAEL